MQIENTVKLPTAITDHLSREALTTAKFMALVPHGDGGCQFEIHAGGANVEMTIDTDGRITSVSFELCAELR